ncbi:MAG TPA: aminotransferase class I/II-fold pyridoxal phosphate-dependent enzyme [Vicinamibacterales bacterium]|nr:aminotransferase class I/II-fold pyridoxal phosphate-dependent enzyme [Vicinamibacterales bacterium]
MNTSDYRNLMEQAVRAVEQANTRIRELEQQTSEPIAIVGIGCRFPGDCDTPDAYFTRLCAGMDAVGEVPPERWSLSEWWDSNPDAPGRMYSRFGAFLSDVDRLDAAFFGITPREAARMDPQHRMLLEVTWHATEAANIRAEALNGKPVGVFVGITANDYGELLDRRGPEEVDAYYLTGNSLNFAAGRVAYVFGFQGPAMAIDTACSSSLVAVHLAVQSLRARESEVAIAAGVNAILSPKGHVLTSKARMLSPTGRCRTFDAGADGIVRGEGCGVVVLKRLCDAQRDGNPIVALILGTATGQDGASAGLTVPSRDAQASVIRAALANARVAPRAIDYVECHGTGTPLGDPIEVRALASVMCAERDLSRPLLIGSVKTNVGHLESASGMAGLIKTALAVQRGVVPAHLHLQRPSPHVDWDELPLRIPRETVLWPGTAGPRLAGVSSFGGSGTNAHVIIGQAPGDASLDPEVQEQEARDEDYSLLLLSARSEPSLSAFAESCRQQLEAGRSLASLSHALLSSRTRHAHRTVVVARSSAEAAEKLRDRARGGHASGVFTGRVASRASRRIAGLFTGQGAVYAGMGRELFTREPAFRLAFERCDETLRPLVGWSLIEALHTASDADLIATERAQPLLFALQSALVSTWSQFGIHLDVVVGHSVGEVAAAHTAGIVSFEDACRWVAARARFMQASGAGGAMLAVRPPEAEARALAARLGRCELAVVNGRSRSVLAGDTGAIDALEAELLANKIDARRLRVSHAFHSSHMDAALPELGRALAGLSFHAPTIPLISGVTGDVLDDASAVRPEFWTQQVRKPVRFAAAAGRLARMDLRHAIELGPQPQLLEMLAEDHPDRFVLIPSLRRGLPDRFVQLCAAGALLADGVDVHLPASSNKRSGAFPPYPFERTHYPLGAPKPPISPANGPVVPRVFESVVDLTTIPALAHHRIGGAVVVPASFWLTSVLDREREQQQGADLCLADVVFERALVLAEDERRRMRITVESPANGHAFRVESCPFGGGGSEEWIVHARGRLRQGDAIAPPEATSDVRARCSTHISGDLFRHAFATVGIDLGSHFSWIVEAWLGSGEAFARLRSIQSAEDTCYDTTGWPPGLLDSLFQLLGGTLDFDQRTAGIRVPYLLEDLRATRYTGTELFAHAKLRPGSTDHWIGDLRMWSEDPSTPCDVLVRGLHLKPVTLRALEAGVRVERDATLDIRWNPIAHKQNASCQGPWLVVGERQGLASELTGLLTERGQTAIRIQAGDSSERLGADLHLEPRHVVYVAGTPRTDDRAGGALSRDAVHALQLVQGVLRNEQPRTPPRLWIITQDAVIVDGEQPATDGAGSAPLWGLGRTLALEHPELQPTLIDLRSSEASAEALLRAIDVAGAEDQLALRGLRVLARRLARPRPEERLQVPETPFKAVATGNTIGDLEYRESARRAPGPDEVEIAVAAVGLNFRDVLGVLGVVPAPNGVLGAECAGRITAVGSAVADFRVGDRVLAVFASDGALASHTVASARNVCPIPDDLTDEEAVTLPVAFLTALYGLRELGELKAGQRVLVHAGAGGVGQAAVQVARQMGLKVVATAGSAAKRALLERQGVEATCDSRSASFAQAIRDAGLSIDAVLGAVTGDIRDESVRLLVPGGAYLEMGKRDLFTPERAGGRRYIPFDIIELGLRDPLRLRALLDEIVRGVREKTYRPLPCQCFPADKLREAFAFFAQGRNVGKVVISLAREGEKATSTRNREDATYVVTGGFGSVGLATADWLVNGGAKHIVLMGRTGADDDALQRIHELEKRGAHVVQLACDVADADALETTWTSVRAALPPVRGVFHAAGVLRDALATNTTVEDCQAVLEPKVAGAWNLVRVLGDQPLDYFVLYSSAAAVFGSPGQSAYAMANSALSRLAHALRARGIPATAADFGPWSGAGMAARTPSGTGSRWNALGLRPLSSARAFAALEDAIDAGRVECVICDIEDGGQKNAPVTLLRLFERMGQATGGQAAVDLAGIPPAERAHVVRAQVRLQVARAMGLNPDDPIDESASLGDLGLDSLMAVELKNALASRLGVQLPISVLADRPSLSQLFDIVLEHIPGAGRAIEVPAASTSRSTTIPADPAKAPVPHAKSSFEVLEERMAPLQARLDLARAAGAYYFETPLVALDGPNVTSADGERKIMFATYSYLGLLGHPRISAAAEEAVRMYGTGTHGVRLNGGTLDLHKRLESRIAQYLDREAAITFSSGFMTNVAVITSLVRPGDWVISDQWNHASIVDGCNASGGVFRVYPHGDLDALEKILGEAPSGVLKLVVSDAVFSLDGDVMDLPAISACCRRHGALLMVDEAHSIGILGPSGRGIEAHFGMKGAIDVCMGTLSKTIPAVGGFVAGSRQLIEFLRFTARGYVFSAAMPPAVAAAALASFDVLEEEGEERQRALMENVNFFLEGLRAAGLDTGRTTTAIIPVIVGSEERAVALTKYCQDRGLFAMPVLPPAVPVGTARLRLNVMATHTREDLERALAVIIEGSRQLPSSNGSMPLQLSAAGAMR